MTAADLHTLIEAGEDIHHEFKSNFNVETIETLVAFANTEGGSVLVGVSDNGKVVGVQIGKETAQQWLNEIKTKTSPMLIPNIETFWVDNKAVVAFSVGEYPVKPVSVKGKFFKRVINSNYLLSAREVSDIYMQSMQYSWDAYVYPYAELDDLDLSKIEIFTQNVLANKRLNISGTPMDILRKLNLIKDEKPTNGAMLLFAKKPLMFDVHAGRLKTKDYILDDIVIRDTLYNAVETTMKYIISHLKVAYEISTETVKQSTQRKEIFEYPLEALREMVLNAVIHRKYNSPGDIQIKIFDNRITIFNPGKLYGDLSIDDLKSDFYHSSPRNKLIVEAFFLTGDIEKYGTGFHRIRNAIEKYPTMQFNFREMQDGFLSELYYDVSPVDKSVGKSVDKSVGKSVGKSIDVILQEIKKTPDITTAILAEITGLSVRGVEKNIALLKKQGLIVRVGSSRKGYWKIMDENE